MQKSFRWVLVTSFAIAAIASLVEPAAAAEEGGRRIVHTVMDPGTGSLIRIHQAGTAFIVDLAKGDVSVTKEVADKRIVTTIRAGAETLVLVNDARGLTLTSTGKTIRAGLSAEDDAVRIREAVRGSAAVARAASLVRDLDLPKTSPLTALLFPTRAMLLAAVDDREGLTRITRAMHDSLRAPAVVRVEDEGPGDCWNEYAKEAIAAFMEFEDCMKNASFVERWLGTCEAIYTMRATGAFAWWVKCVGLSNS